MGSKDSGKGVVVLMASARPKLNVPLNRSSAVVTEAGLSIISVAGEAV